MLLDKISNDISNKKKYLSYRARTKKLPANYRATAAALERYLMNLGPSDNADSLIAMLNDLADLLEQSAVAGTPVRDVVGTDPADFADAFMENYDGGSWVRKERDRLSAAIDRAAAEPTT
jgi:DNA-binding ferritin-like protein (Dps family)